MFQQTQSLGYLIPYGIFTPSIPECISIDEFKGNADTGKYQCILVDR